MYLLTFSALREKSQKEIVEMEKKLKTDKENILSRSEELLKSERMNEEKRLRAEMEKDLEKFREEVEALQEDEQSKLDKDKEQALGRIRREVGDMYWVPTVMEIQGESWKKLLSWKSHGKSKKYQKSWKIKNFTLICV